MFGYKRVDDPVPIGQLLTTLGVVRDKKPMMLKGKIETPPASKRPTVRTIV